MSEEGDPMNEDGEGGANQGMGMSTRGMVAAMTAAAAGSPPICYFVQ